MVKRFHSLGVSRLLLQAPRQKESSIIVVGLQFHSLLQQFRFFRRIPDLALQKSPIKKTTRIIGCKPARNVEFVLRFILAMKICKNPRTIDMSRRQVRGKLQGDGDLLQCLGKLTCVGKRYRKVHMSVRGTRRYLDYSVKESKRFGTLADPMFYLCQERKNLYILRHKLCSLDQERLSLCKPALRRKVLSL